MPTALRIASGRAAFSSSIEASGSVHCQPPKTVRCGNRAQGLQIRVSGSNRRQDLEAPGGEHAAGFVPQHSGGSQD